MLRSAAAAVAGALALPGTGSAAASAPHRWIGAGPFTHVHDPSVPGRQRYLNDHTLIKASGRWHLFGIVGDSARPGESPDSAAEVTFAHASAPDPYGPWTTHADALTVDRSYFGEEHLWAPHVVEAGGTYWMFYAAGGRSGAAINLATSTDLFTWTRVPSGPLFRGLAARDPMVLRVADEWVMYYTELSAPHGRHIVAVRRSADLVHWSAPETAFTDPSTDATLSVTESPCVVERDGWYHLFIGPGAATRVRTCSRPGTRSASARAITRAMSQATPSRWSPTGRTGTRAPRAGSAKACTWHPCSGGTTHRRRGRAWTTRSPHSTWTAG
ncbi:family 43 glycosylhydrolase [Streptomyces sp. NPDC059761]|uniref:family 43 glycosylhydrolase n=1 Tax=Streptomyces sp. NPDC059761 TaxID=3346937 RepID=UPI003666AA9A